MKFAKYLTTFSVFSVVVGFIHPVEAITSLKTTFTPETPLTGFNIGDGSIESIVFYWSTNTDVGVETDLID